MCKLQLVWDSTNKRFDEKLTARNHFTFVLSWESNVNWECIGLFSFAVRVIEKTLAILSANRIKTKNCPLAFSRASSSLHVFFYFAPLLPHGCCRDNFFFHSYSDAWRRRRRRRRSGKMDEGADVTSQLQDSADEGKEIPIHAKEVIEALQDLEDEYDLHPKHAV